MPKLVQLAYEIGKKLQHSKCLLVTAESCTGGWLAQVMTANAGSSQWFDRGFVSYSNRAKQQLLGVTTAILEQYGAVSEAVAVAMAQGALAHSDADIAIAITGIAGPNGGSVAKPVGMVCVSCVTKTGSCEVSTQFFNGTRKQIRYAAVKYALYLLQQIVAQ